MHKNVAYLEMLEYQIWDMKQQAVATREQKANPNEFIEELISAVLIQI